jgi:filamentous hemagglutinin family protein
MQHEQRRPAIQLVTARKSSHALLLVGVSAIALLIGAGSALAGGKSLQGSIAASPTTTAVNTAQQGLQQGADAAQRAKDALARSTQALQAMQAVQAAAHNLALTTPSNLPNGLLTGGLDPAIPKPQDTSKASPNPSSQDPTGLQVWDGALYPTQSVSSSGHVDVNVKQVQTNAILSWKTFNVGRDTTLTFDQQGHTNWVALNRVTGNSVAPSQILGAIKADGTVLVINQNGIIFSGSSQINVGSLIASTLDVGGQGTAQNPSTVFNRNQQFLQTGFLGGNNIGFSTPLNAPIPGDIQVEKGASITTNGTDGLILMMGHHVENDGYLSSPAGQVALLAVGAVGITKATGSSDSADPNVRGLLFSDLTGETVGSSFYVRNGADGLIEADQGNITLLTPANVSDTGVGGAIVHFEGGAVVNDGLLYATTSVSRNGSILIGGGDIRLSPGSTVAIPADTGGQTIPQDPTSLSNFKPSEISIGSPTSNVEMESGAFLYAPAANVYFGGKGGGISVPLGSTGPTADLPSTIFIDSGAVIDVAGLADVEVPASRNEIEITPLKGNELRDAPLFRVLFNGATVYLDPRISGVRDDGVAWIGSPLVDAKSYYQLVGVTAAELMTKGGSVSFGNSSVTVKSGAVVDISGGWVTYQAGNIRQSQVVTANGQVIDISQADPNGNYIGIYNGFVIDHDHWGIKETYSDPLHADMHYEASYTEGRDAGSLSVTANAIIFDTTPYADAYAGAAQLASSKKGSGKSANALDTRALQGAPSELPAGGLLSFLSEGDMVVSHDPAPIPDSVTYGQPVVIAPDGSYTGQLGTPASYFPTSRAATTQISDAIVNGAGLSEFALNAAGSITVNADAAIELNPGGVFSATSGRSITVNGDIIAPGGSITLKTAANTVGSLFNPTTASLGSFDIVVNGTLSVAGRWVNDFQPGPDGYEGGAWLDGGSISMTVASNVLQYADGTIPSGGSHQIDATTLTSPTLHEPIYDISGSILINAGSTLNLNSGGRVDQKGNLQLTAKGGSLTLRSETEYFQNADGVSSFRVASVPPDGSSLARATTDNPGQINARVAIDPNAIQAHGFGGGGTFTLETPQIEFGEGTPDVGTILPMDFFSTAGFANYNITSYKTDFFASTFNNGFGGYNAVLATQTLTVGPGQTLSLVQSVLPSLVNEAQGDMLRGLASGSDVASLFSPIVPSDAWDQKAVNLTLGGLVELHVAQGGSIVGAPGAALTVPKLLNEGLIRLPGGSLTQQLVLPGFYGSPANDHQGSVAAARSLDELFTVSADGTIDLNAQSHVAGQTNQKLAMSNGTIQTRIYLLGLLDADQGIVLAPGSVTDLSGTVVQNPYAVGNGQPISAGKILPGGTLATAHTVSDTGANMFGPINLANAAAAPGVGQTDAWIVPEKLIAQPGAAINISGASGSFDQAPNSLKQSSLAQPAGFTSVPVWSDAGALVASNGGTLTGAIINAHGGAPQANGGVLGFLNPIFAQNDPATPTANIVSAAMIANAGFDTVDATGSINSSGDVTLKLRGKFILEGLPFDIGRDATSANTETVPTIQSSGAMEIDAPYIGFVSAFDALQSGVAVATGNHSVVFNANAIDITGSLVLGKTVANASFQSAGDIRLIGVQPWQLTFNVLQNGQTPPPTLNGALAAGGNLSLAAAQIYPTTGSTFTVTSAAANGTITIGRSSSDTPAMPYSAGGSLGIFAANIVQGGVVRVPFGTLTLGSNAAYTNTLPTGAITLAPPAQNVTLADGSITGVSADGLIIPYGTTTDQKEWFFSPTGTTALSGPPTKVMSLNAGNVSIDKGATVDLTGGGDVYAYEFVPGTGGSRDVLSRTNSDQYSSNGGLQYPDGRQIYAIVPSLANVPVATYDPIYSAGYGNLYNGSAVGQRVYLDAAPGLAAGWYTLLPAQYALLPGGMRVVEETGATGVLPGTGVQQRDGSLLVSGYYGNAISGTSQSQERLFSVESQTVILQNSKIVTTLGTTNFTALAVANGNQAPPLAADAGRLVINPLANLNIDAPLLTQPAAGGRQSEVDIGGLNFDIVSDLSQAPADGAIHLTTASLNNLNAGSLLIGGARVDNADGTTTLAITAQTITVENDADHPLIAPEIILAVDDTPNNPVASRLTLKDGATLIATGTLADQRSGAYIVNGKEIFTTANFGLNVTFAANSDQGALFRVANGPQRVVDRTIGSDGTTPFPDGTLTVGNVNVQGSAIGLDTSANITVSPDVNFQAKSIALGATAMAFTSSSAAPGTVVITPELLASLSKADNLTLRSQTSIGFDNGSYTFGSTTLDAANLLSLQNGVVNIVAKNLEFTNSGTTTGTAAGGGGTLNIVADTFSIGSNTIVTTGFGAGVNVTAAGGVFAAGTNGALDVGGANLALTTPYIGDRPVTGLPTETGYAATFTTTGNVTISNTIAGNTQMAALDPATVGGVSGASITINGNNISVSGTTVHATSGSVTLKAGDTITLSNQAVIEAPGFEKTFGDSVDPQIRSAPGGSVSLAADGSGGISLGDATLSVGGGTGNAGTLSLSTPNGAVDFGNATLNGKGGVGGIDGADGAGGVFSIDTKGAFDLVALNALVTGDGFTGGFDVRTRTGDLVLGAGQVLKSGSVSLTADGGVVTIGGTIDTSGINGGDIGLYGTQGVTLQGTAQLIARATGYGYTAVTDDNGNVTYAPTGDTRQAKGGDITLGTDFLAGSATTNADGSVSGISGTINVAAGALIDVSALHPSDRVVPMVQLGATYYQAVQGDQGGTVTFRAPVQGTVTETVKVNVASANSVVGARAVVLEAFKRWDLVAVANSGLYTGVSTSAQDATIAANTVVLDTRAGLDTANVNGTRDTVAGLNFLGDDGAGTIVNYIQNFDVSAAYGNLGGLASQSNFHAQPGLDLATTGNIVLASNLNFGAGTVNLAGAQSAGDLRQNPVLQVAGDPTTGYVANAGAEADIFQRFTTMIYRTDHGSVGGEAPVLSLRAGGDLDIKGSISDGLFLFHDQSNPIFLSLFDATFYANYNAVINGGLSKGANSPALTNWSLLPSTFSIALGDPALTFVGLSLNSGGMASTGTATPSGVTSLDTPYSAIGNSPAALGSFKADSSGNVDGGGNPLGSAVVFPLFADGSAANSATYRLVAGSANLAGAPSIAQAQNSANPLAINRAGSGTLTVEGVSSYTYSSISGGNSTGTPGTAVVDTNLNLVSTGGSGTGSAGPDTSGTLDLAAWINYIASQPQVSDNGVAVLDLGVLGGGDSQRAVVINAFKSYMADRVTNGNPMVINSTDPAVGYHLSLPTATLDTTSYIMLSFGSFKDFVTNYLAPVASQLAANVGAPNANPGTQTAVVQSLIRTGTGSIALAAANTADLRGSANPVYVDIQSGRIVTDPASQSNNSNGFGVAQLGGSAIYTVGNLSKPAPEIINDPDFGTVSVDPTPALQAQSFISVFGQQVSNTAPFNAVQGQAPGLYSAQGVLRADLVYLNGGGDVSVTAGQDVLGRADLYFNFDHRFNNNTVGTTNPAAHPWDAAASFSDGTQQARTTGIDPQLFREGLGAFGGGNITIKAGRDVSDITAASDGSILYGTAVQGSLLTQMALRVGSGNVTINAGGNVLGSRIDVASGVANVSAGGDVGDAAPFNFGTTGVELRGDGIPLGGIIEQLPFIRRDQTYVTIDDAVVNLNARGAISIQDIYALGGASPSQEVVFTGQFPVLPGAFTGIGTYSAYAALNMVANADTTITNTDNTVPDGSSLGFTTSFIQPTGGVLFPGSLTATSIGGSITLPAPVLMAASPVGQLQLFAGANIAPTGLAMLDNDPGIAETTFPTVLSNTTDTQIANQHNKNITHANDPTPVYLYAGNDINNVILNVPKQARITAGEDIVNMMFFGQNIAPTDVTRIVAGRDITATSVLSTPIIFARNNATGFLGAVPGGAPEPALQGNTFIIGGPGEFFLEAGRNMGPFLNSAVFTQVNVPNTGSPSTVGPLTMLGGVVSVGNGWNPNLPTQGAEVNVLFGLGKGADFNALRDAYVVPGTAANALGDYSAKLASWMQQNVPGFDPTGMSMDDVYAAFLKLPEVKQHVFLIDDVYFNELRATDDVNSPSFHKYSRGYLAVNTLFPASLGFTANGLEGGAASDGIVHTGDLDLRLSTIETQRGGNINILGPGGRVLAGSVVATTVQAARRSYDGYVLYTADEPYAFFHFPNFNDFPAAAIKSIPAGGEGVLTLRGGDINTFTDGDFLLNQSRLFTEQGGNILMWSSNADLNAGQGAKTSANFPPIVVHVDDNMVSTVDELGGVTGAGIASLQSTPDSPPGDVFLIAPRGTVDAGDAGVRVSGNLTVSARFVLNADNFKVQGTSTGIPTVAAVNTGALTTANNNTAVTKKVDTGSTNSDQPSIIIVEFLGFGGGEGTKSTSAPAATSNAPAPSNNTNQQCDPSDANCH